MARKFTKLFLGNIVYAIGKRIFRKIASIFTLPKPTLVIDGDEMIIGDASGRATGVEIYANGELVKMLSIFTVKITGGDSGEHRFVYPHGMTWADFINSDYNKIVNGERSFGVSKDGYYVDFNGAVYGYGETMIGLGTETGTTSGYYLVALTSKIGDYDTYYHRTRKKE